MDEMSMKTTFFYKLLLLVKNHRQSISSWGQGLQLAVESDPVEMAQSGRS